MNNIYLNAEHSITKAVVDLVQEAKTANLSADIQYLEIDARKELDDGSLPPTDVMGITQFALAQQDQSLWMVHFMVGISTVNDTNLFRLRDLANLVFNRMQGGNTMDLYDSASGTKATWIYILPETASLPTHRVETRPFRFIQVQALIDPLGLSLSEGSPQEP